MFEPKEYAKTLRPNSEAWRIMSEKEVAFLMTQTRGTDCANFKDPSRDRWNRKINIALRRSDTTANRVDIIMWSNGPDGKSGTDDDLVMPYGHEVPK